MPVRSRARWQLATAAALFSTGGAAIKAADFTAWQTAGLRSGIAAVAILLISPAARRGWTVRAVLGGFAYAASLTRVKRVDQLHRVDGDALEVRLTWS